MVRLAVLLALGGCVLGADAHPAPAAPPPAAPAGTADAHPAADTTPTLIALNTVCPVDGAKIDPNIPPVPAHTRSGRLIGIGVCSTACAQQVRANPSLYVADAVANRRHRP